MTASSKPRAKRTKHPKHAVTHRVIEAVLDASPAMSTRMQGWLDLLHALREQLRRDREEDRAVGRAVRAAGGEHKYLTKNDQYKTVSALASSDPAYARLHSQVLQNVADRVADGTQAWLEGERGPLKFSPRKDYRSFTFTQYGFAVKIRHARLHLSHLGHARLIGLRKLPGRVKGTTLVFKQGRWFVQFTCEVQVQHSEQARRNASDDVRMLPDTGLDTGVARVATLADGTAFLPGKPLKKALPRLRVEQRTMSRQFEARKRAFADYRADFKACELHGPLPERNHRPLSNRLKRQIRRVAILHTKVTCTRRDQLRKLARQLEQQFRLIAVEEHSVKFMFANRRMSRAVSDVAPAMFKGILKNTLGAGRYVGVGNARPGIGGNSQTCLCRAAVHKTLEDRWHLCKACGLSADRDTVSANIAMEIAFSYSNLGAAKPPEPGQGFVRRGEDKGPTSTTVRAARRAARPKATESSVKRSSTPGFKPAFTAGAQATAGVNNLQLLNGAQAPRLSG